MTETARATGRKWSVVPILVFVIAAGAACAKSATVAAAGGSTSSGPVKCGGVSIPMATGKPAPGPGTKVGAESCFAQAFAACRPASMQITWWGVDAGTKATLTISGSPCQVDVAPSVYRIPSFSSPQPSYSCGNVAFGSTGLDVSGCTGGKAITLPTDSAAASGS